MTGRFDDDDWVGTPPEGRHTRDQADPAFWARQWKPQLIVFGVLGILVTVVLVLALS
jgi:hypothetical protein